MDFSLKEEGVDFGALPGPVDMLLRQGVVACQSDRLRADRLFRQALDLAPEALPAYFCLYRVHASMGNLDAARAAARDGLREAARQAGWPADPRRWPQSQSPTEGPARFALSTLQALAHIELTRGDREAAQALFDILAAVDPAGRVGRPASSTSADAAVTAVWD
ncbi:MAG: hypothetical protein EKK29_22275 [Hyphomicrobiales bacterium]|nr:MAG: hypothetical protein EKK29_22275 [Hyphomicrobiales bacterium]